uniref:solute carrier family 22 member 11 isoform X1 n=1 Tax=Jaculus jaculus TaxID=51337 RepID=UPI0003330473|nr:solute carrier family 22 member 11 isoform X1 [Jaculus jaculus]XP_045000376.1 solute carrier family 22 member 11 isoform X1 [Jaculus jaculus]XP_045000382.1 solute carrier family 22 member 11 isoform X1 [Jaculus jaculus]
MAFEDLLAQAGGAGLSHVLQVITMLLPAILIPLHMLLENFSAAIPDHRCWAHILDNSSEVPANLIHEALLTVSIPTGPNQQLHQCRRFHQPQWQLLDANTTATNWSDASTEPCMDGWVYDNRTFTSTVVTTWDLVCDSQGLKPMGQSIFMAGILAGAFIWGVLSHRFGRKSMLCWCCLQVGMAGTSAIFAPHFLIYCGLRFLSAFGIAGIILAQTVLLMEWTTTCKRTVTMTILGCTYSLGQMVLAGLAFVLRDWRDLQLAASVPFLAIFLLSWWLPESARWLIATGQPARALQELHKVARINGCKEAKKTLTLEVLMSSMGEEAGSSREQAAVLDLFCVPLLCPRTCTMMTVSFSLMLSYYGLVLDLQSLGGDIFLLQTLFGAVDFLGRATTILLLRFLGRRVTLAGSQALAGLCILANVLVPQDLQTLRVALAVMGKGCFGVSLTCFSMYRTELFPTPLRMTADGFLQSVGRLGAMMGPLLRTACQALPLLPPLTYGALPIASSLLLLLVLPETQGLPLPDTIQDLARRPATARSHQREIVLMESTWL